MIDCEPCYIIDNNKLKDIIKDEKKVLILAPKHSGKSMFLIDFFKEIDCDMYYYCSDDLHSISLQFKLQQQGISFYRTNIRIFNQDYDAFHNDRNTLLIDNCLSYEFEMAELIANDCKIIIISNTPNENYNFEVFTTKGFRLINAPLIPIYEYD